MQKIKKHYYGFISIQNGMGPAEIERKMKIIAPIHSISTRNRAFQKNIKKVKNIIMASFQAKTAQERLRMWEKKNSRSDTLQPDPK